MKLVHAMGWLADVANHLGMSTCAHVGAVGFTLGGGPSPLSRTFGIACDWVRPFRVVGADGEVVTASTTEHPDLFWALKAASGDSESSLRCALNPSR